MADLVRDTKSVQGGIQRLGAVTPGNVPGDVFTTMTALTDTTYIAAWQQVGQFRFGILADGRTQFFRLSGPPVTPVLGTVWLEDNGGITSLNYRGLQGNVSIFGSGGTVTSVGLSLPAALFQVTGSPVTTSGDLTATLADQVANRVWAGPTGGPDAAPNFRALVAADLPSLSAIYLPLAGGTMNAGSTLVTAATATGQAGLRLPHGTAPSAPVNGDIWTTTTGPAIQVNGSTTNLVTGTGSAGRIALWSAAGVQTFYSSLSASSSGFSYGQAAQSSGTAVAWTVAGGAHTNLTSGAEVIGVNFNLAQIVQHAAGALATQRAFVIQAPTYSFASASTLTTAATFAVTGAPIAGTNATLTNSYAIWVQAGKLATAASTTTVAGLSVPHGTAPSSPVDGDMWTTTLGIYARINGATIGPLGAGSAGTVTSVGLSLPAIFSVSGSPVTTSGTLTATLATQTANLVFAGPASGAASAPSFRVAVPLDIAATPAANQILQATSGTTMAWITVGGDATISGGTLTLANTITAGGPTGSTSVVPVITYDAKGRLTAVTTATITPAAIGAQPLDAGLTSIAALTGSGYVKATATDAFTMQTGVPYADLTGIPAAIDAIDGLTPVADGLFYYTSGSAAAITTLTAFARTLLDDVDAAAMRTTLAVPPDSRQIATQYSVTGGGDLTADRTLSLVGDVSVPGNNKYYGTDGSGTRGWYTNAGGGTVSSVGLSAPAQFNVTGSPVTTSGTLTLAWANASQNFVFAGPGSGGAGVPVFRALVAADIPSLSTVYLPLAGGTMNSASTLITAAPASGQAGFRLPHGTGPSSPTNGDFWTTTAGIFARVNTSTISLVHGSGASGEIALWSGTGSQLSSYAGLTATAFTFTYLQDDQTSGSPSAFVVTGAPHTTLAASTEAVDINFNLARTVQFSVGALATQRAFVIQAPTYGFTGGSVVTNAATLAITGAPVAGTNATLTNRYALWIQSGRSGFGGQVMLAASSTTEASLNIPHGTAPSAPVNGDTWTTTAGLYVRVNGSTVGPLGTGGGGITGSGTANSVTVWTGASAIDELTAFTATDAALRYTQQVQTSGVSTAFRIDAAASTAQTASTEVIDVNFNLARIIQHATGALATQRAFVVQAPTYSFVGASVVTTAATFAITGAPVAGTNATLTSSYALWVQDGQSWFDDSGTFSAASAPLRSNLTDTSATSQQVFRLSTAAGGGLAFNVEDASQANPVWQMNINASEQLAFLFGGTEQARFDSSGRFLTGATASRTIGSAIGRIQIETTAAASFSIVRDSNDANANYFVFGKSRGGLGGITTLTGDDNIGIIRFCGADGTDINTIAAEIVAEVGGAVTTNVVPGRLRVRVMDDVGTIREAIRVSPVSGSSGFAGVAFATIDCLPLAAYSAANVSTLQLIRNSAGNNTAHLMVASFTAGAGSAAMSTITLARSNASALSTYTACTSTSTLGDIRWDGADGTSMALAARILGSVDGTVAAGIVPGKLDFYTTDSTGTSTLAATLTSAQRFLVGIGTTQTQYTASTVTPRVQFVGTSTSNAAVSVARFSANAFGPGMYFAKTRGGGGVYTIVQVADELGNISFQGADGTDLAEAASITVTVIGTPASNIVQGKMVFSAANSAGTIADRMSIQSDAVVVTNANGSTTPISAFNAATWTPGLQIISGANVDTGFLGISSFSATAGNSCGITLARAKSGTIGTYTAVATNDVIGQIYFEGSDGTDFARAARIYASVNGTVAANQVPADLIFQTADSAGALSTALTLGSNNNATFTGTVITPATATTAAGLRLPHGTAPSAPTNGDVWTTTAGLYVRINGATVGPFSAGAGTVTGTGTAGRVALWSGASAITDDANLTYSGIRLYVGQTASTGTVSSVLQVVGAAHTALTASTERFDVNFDMARTVQWATGALATQRAVVVQAPTYGFVSGSTITSAATFAITGAPVAGTNATITNSYALWVQAGTSNFGGLVRTVASAAGGAGFRLPHGAAPTTPVDGDLWTTTAVMSLRLNGATVNVPTGTGGSTQVAIWTGTGTGLTAVSGFTCSATEIAWNQGNATNGLPVALTITGGSHTTLTSGENNDVAFLFNRTVNKQTGSYTSQRAFWIRPPTYSFVGASVVTNAATMAIEGPPVAGSNATLTNIFTFWIMTGTSRFDGPIAANGGVAPLVITQSVGTGAAGVAFTVTGAAHTSLTASGERFDVNFNLGRTVQWASGALATQRAMVIQAPTYGFVGASVLTNAATVAITGAPVAGTNATITNSYALWIQAGKLGTAATATTGAGLNLPHGTAPTSPVNGDIWTTTGGLFARINGSTITYGGGITGLTTNRVPYATSSTGLGDNANMVWDTVNSALVLGTDPGGTYRLRVGGVLYATQVYGLTITSESNFISSGGSDITTTTTATDYALYSGVPAGGFLILVVDEAGSQMALVQWQTNTSPNVINNTLTSHTFTQTGSAGNWNLNIRRSGGSAKTVRWMAISTF